MDSRPLTDATVDEVLERLGFATRPNADLEGLGAVYGAWCTSVPFDNLRKLVALHFSMPELPGIEPADFFAAWLLTGAGGTCWSSNNALHALLVGLGFDARLHAGSMLDGEINHGTTIVTLEATDWLVDSTIHSGAPLALVPDTVASVDHHGHVVTARPDPGGWLVHAPTSDPDFDIPCRLHGPIDHAFAHAANERSRHWSPFNTEVMCQTNDAAGVWMVKGNDYTRFDDRGRTRGTMTDAEVDVFLVEHAGHSAQLVAEVRAVLTVEEGDAQS